MGLIYIPTDANLVETQLTSDLQMSRTFLNRLKMATTHLTTVVGGGKLDGKAYRKGLGLMQDCVLPTIKHATSAIDGITQDLAAFTSAKSYMPNEPLYEDKLVAQIAELNVQKSAQEALSAVYQHHILSLVAGPIGVAIDLAISQFTDAKQQLDNWGNSVDEEIRKTQEKLDKLRQYNAQTTHLFQDSLSKLKLAMQGVAALNGSSINSDGSYRLASGMDKSWFRKVHNGKKGKSTRENNLSLDTDWTDGDVGVKARAGKTNSNRSFGINVKKTSKEFEVPQKVLESWIKKQTKQQFKDYLKTISEAAIFDANIEKYAKAGDLLLKADKFIGYTKILTNIQKNMKKLEISMLV